MDRLRYVRQIERRDPRLGRHVHHDSMSRLYPFRAPAKLDLKPTVHPRHVSVFDQGNLGSCVPNAVDAVPDHHRDELVSVNVRPVSVR
jgi:hypothetical protein